MNANQLTKDAVSKMDLATANSALTVSGITAMQRQLIQTRIKKLSTPAPEVQAPVETVQDIIAGEATTSDVPEVSAPAEIIILAKVEKNKPGETTRTIEKFTDDTKGIRAGSKVTFLENNKPGAKTLTGSVQRVFDFYLKPERQEVKIKGDNGQRYYRFETGVHPIVEVVAEVITPEVITPEVVEEPKA
jgi:hypothetical protein